MEKIKPYEKYKDSGIAWLGRIPQHWVEFKPKTIGYLFGGLTGKKGDDFKIEKELNISPYIPFTNIANNFIIDKNKLAFVKTLENEKQNLVKKNDLLFLMSSENFEDIGKTSLLNDQIEGLYLNSFCKGFRIEDSNFYPKFLNYIFSADVNRKRLSVEARGFTRINLKIGKVNDLAMFAPANISEQTAIANFLDYKTAKIDRFIFKKKQLIKLLNEQKAAIINDAVTKGLNSNAKMKPSGIEWLGDIPEHWEVRKLKYVMNYFKGFAFKSSDFFESGIPIIKASNIKKGTIKNELSYIAIGNQRSEFESVRLNVGDIIITTVGSKPEITNSSVGQIAIISEDFNNTYLNQNTMCLRPLSNTIYQEFAKHFMTSKYMRAVLDSISLCIVNQAYLLVDAVMNIGLALPLIGEQIAIVSHIEKETSIITKAITTIEREISLVQEYRTALIAEAVTGKIDVREYKVPSFEEVKEYAEMEEEMGLVAEEEISLD